MPRTPGSGSRLGRCQRCCFDGVSVAWGSRRAIDRLLLCGGLVILFERGEGRNWGLAPNHVGSDLPHAPRKGNVGWGVNANGKR
jgi:hypothetical protein